MDIDPDEIDGDIYDILENLDTYANVLSDMIANNTISEEEFNNEMLKTNYYRDIRTKEYVLDDDDSKMIEKLRQIKSTVIYDFKYGGISQEEFNRQYTNILRSEYSILKMNETDKKDSSQKAIDIDFPLDLRLKAYHDEEMRYFTNIARDKGIKIPKRPSTYDKEYIDNYYDLKITNMLKQEDVIDEIEDYLAKLSASKKLIGYYTSSYEIPRMMYSDKLNKLEYKFVKPMADRLKDIKFQERRSNFLTPEEEIYSDRLNIIANNLRKLSRDDLLKCVETKTFKIMSYIETLKTNKHRVFKFKEHPENYEDLKNILNEENLKYYKINSNDLYKNYIITRPEILGEYKNENLNSSTYQQSGQISYLALKPGVDPKNIKNNLDDFVTVKPMTDELYEELKDLSGDLTEIGTVWELRTTIDGDDRRKIITRRYLNFEDYLKELKNVLKENSKKLSGKSRDILNAKIRKISYYLEYKEDPELYLGEGNNQLTVSEMFKERSEIYTNRKSGLEKILFYISRYYPDCEALVDKLEEDIFNYASRNYNYNIDKVLFIFKNYYDKLEDIVIGKESIINILTYETPKIIPEDDINPGDKEYSIDYLINWRPKTTNYDYYEKELKDSNHNFNMFSRSNKNITNIMLRQIMLEYSEKLQWDKSLEKFSNLEAPEGYIELNFKLRFLIKERNKLPSRRIYRVTTVADRIKTQRTLKNIFEKCNLKESEDYSILTENIIFNTSSSEYDYDYYYKIIKNRYTELCKFFSRLNLNCKLDSDGKVKCIMSFEPKLMTPIITEFIINEGDLDTVDINKLNKLKEELEGNQGILSYLNYLRPEEINTLSSIAADDKIMNKPIDNRKTFSKAIKILKDNWKNEMYKKAELIAYNTYKPPIVLYSKPVRIHKNKEYELPFIKIGEKYIVGGYYPNFNMLDEDGNIIKQNYSREDIEDLCIIFELDIIDDTYESWKNVMDFIYNYNMNPSVKYVTRSFEPSSTKDYYPYLNTGIKIIRYVTRPRIGVKEPGEVYSVTEDIHKTYAVPFKINENTIPVYSLKQKELSDNGFITIEGPCVFDESIKNFQEVNNKYILIEYLDPRGKSRYFREGVYNKQIISKDISKLNTCKRFKEQKSCDDINSYSLTVNNTKFKCKWLENNCIEILESKEIENFDISLVEFKEFNKQKLWSDAVSKSIQYLEMKTKIEKMSTNDLSILSKDQKYKLYNYWLKLSNENRKSDLKTIYEENESNIKKYTILDAPYLSFLKEDRNKTTIINNDELLSEYENVTIYKKQMVPYVKPNRKLIIGNDYKLNGKVVTIIEITEDNLVLCIVKESGNKILVHKDEFTVKTNLLIEKIIPEFCLINKENLRFMKNFNFYYWIESKEVYERQGDEIYKKVTETRRTDIPLNFIFPSNFINGKPLIEKKDLLEAITYTAYNKLETVDDKIYEIKETIFANKDAVLFSIINHIDLSEIEKTVIGTITLVHVVDYFEKNKLIKFISREDLEKDLLSAVNSKNKLEISKLLTKAKQNKLDKTLIDRAKDVLNEMSDEKDYKEKPEKPREPVNVKPIKSKNIFETNRRR